MHCDEAIALARELLSGQFGPELQLPGGDEVVLITDNISEFGEAWLVPFNSRRYLEGGSPDTALLPSAVLVPKDSAIAPHYPPTALPVAEYLTRVRRGTMPWAVYPPR